MAPRLLLRLLPVALLAPTFIAPPVPAYADDVCVDTTNEHVVLPEKVAPGGKLCAPPAAGQAVDDLERRLLRRDASGVRYIVVLTDDAKSADADLAAEDARRAGATVYHVYRHALRGYVATMNGSTLQTVHDDPRVKYVELDDVAYASAAQTDPPWGLDRIDQRRLPLDRSYSYTTTGAGVTAYVVDSGINYRHVDFGGRAVPGADFIEEFGGAIDCHGHGTHVAGTIGGSTYGVAKGVSLLGVRVLGCDGRGPVSMLLAGVDWVTGHHTGGPAVANLSLRYPPTQAVDDAVRASIADGIAYTVSAGNDGGDACAAPPANVTQAMVIGSSDAVDEVAWASNVGACVDWFAPGFDVLSAWIGGETASNRLHGTSMAAAHNTGAAARYLEVDPLAPPATVESFLRSRTTRDAVRDVWNDRSYPLLYMTAPVHVAAYGRIRVTKHQFARQPTFEVTGVFATDYKCALSLDPVSVTCQAKPNPDVVWECSYFVNTATAPAPGDTGKGFVSTRAACDGPDELVTGDVHGSGVQTAHSWSPPIDMGTAFTVTCTAAGVDGSRYASGSYVADCNEPGVEKPFETA